MRLCAKCRSPLASSFRRDVLRGVDICAPCTDAREKSRMAVRLSRAANLPPLRMLRPEIVNKATERKP